MENFLKKTNFGVGEVSNLIYHVRGRDMMLDTDLARIYGYTTSAFNQQVARNLDRFEGEDFMFRLTRIEVDNLISQNVISSIEDKGWGGTRKLPYAFTEQGIYMLMTVLKGELAVRQSRALVMAFKEMKDYILENRNNRDIGEMKKEIIVMDGRLTRMEKKVMNAVMRSEISPIALDFNKESWLKEMVIKDNEWVEAREAYREIYSIAKQNIIVIDNYVDARTLSLLTSVGDGVNVMVFSDNFGKNLRADDVTAFRKECSEVKIEFKKTCGRIHDRFVILDYETSDEAIYHCGASSKDAGKAVTVISKIEGELAVRSMEKIVKGLMKNPGLALK